MTERRTEPGVPDGLEHVAARLAALARADATAPYVAPALSLDDPALAHPPLQALVAAFGLDAFEAQLLLLALGAELVADVAALCAACHEDDRRWPSLRLALALFPGGAWHSLGPAGALRHWELIEIDPRPLLLDGAVRLSEFALHILCGAPARDPALAALLVPLVPDDLPPSHGEQAARVATLFAALPGGGRVHVDASDRDDARALAPAVAALLDLPAERLDLDALLHAPDRTGVLRRLRREQAFAPALLLVETDADEGDPTRLAALRTLLDQLPGPVLTATPSPSRRVPHDGPRIDLPPPTRAEQYRQWRDLLGRAATPLAPMLARYDLTLPAIRAAYHAAAIARAAARKRDWRPFLSDACRTRLRGALDPLAERLPAGARLDDLILPPVAMAQLRSIIDDVDHQPDVIDRWLAGGGSRRGLGLATLFTGPSGSGKTTAAEAIASALDLDLYRIDLSAVVSKYIGETEKQLATLFAAAQRSASILFFDEAEALFGKRTETRSSNDRFANQEVAYLLQRLETYPGLVILATNLPEAVDQAFLRRFRTIVHFPLPGATEREAMWRRVYRGTTPVADLDPVRLARLNLTGAGIRTVALRAAFLAAANGGAVTMPLLRRAAQEEYAKLHRIMTDDEWPDDAG